MLQLFFIKNTERGIIFGVFPKKTANGIPIASLYIDVVNEGIPLINAHGIRGKTKKKEREKKTNLSRTSWLIKERAWARRVKFIVIEATLILSFSYTGVVIFPGILFHSIDQATPQPAPMQTHTTRGRMRWNCWYLRSLQAVTTAVNVRGPVPGYFVTQWTDTIGT